LVGLLQVLTCHQCEASEATIQYLLHCNYLLEQKLAERHEHNIAVVQSTNISWHGTRSLKPDSVHDSVTDLKVVSYCLFFGIAGLNILVH
jgi:hypothetical protein